MFFINISSFAQNNTTSPYSRFGYGEIADNGSGKSKGMGGVSIGMRSNSSINTANPASYTGIDSLTFLFEFGAFGKQSMFSDKVTSSGKAFTANIEFLTMEFPLTRWLAASAGILPYSVVGYSFSNSDSTSMPTNSGTDNYINNTKTFSGSGNLTQTYGGLSTKIGKHFSFGVNVSYLFGSINNERYLTFDETSGTYASTLQTQTLKVKDVNLRYGLQYFTELKNKNKLTLGLILENKSRLGGTYSIESSGIDTISTSNGSDFQTPLLIGVGGSYTIKDRITLGADFQFQNWANANYFGKTDTLKNSIKVNVGAEFLPAKITKRYFSRVVYRVGANISSGYLNVNGKSPENYALTLGLGLPVRGSKTLINLGFEYGKKGTTSNNQIREDYFKFSVSATFNELWFFKRHFE
jgi:hypothetical protein